MASEPETTPTPSPAEEKIPLGGKEYTAAELQEALRGQMRQSDYTQKTQAVAEERRRLQEEREAWEAEKAARETYRGSDPDDDSDPWVRRFSALESSIGKINDALAQRRAAEAEEREVEEQMEAIETSLHAISTQPGFDRQEVLQTMKRYGWNRPEDVDAAYRIVAGPKIAQAMAERHAAARGAAEPPPMGGTGFPMTTPFSSAQEAAPGQFDASKLSWHDLARMAREDPERPR